MHGHGITLSAQQHAYAVQELRSEIASGQCRIDCCDFREARGWRGFTKATGIGILEHAGPGLAAAYFEVAYSALVEGGLFLNQAITWCGQAHEDRIDPFVDGYVFPGGQLLTIDETIRYAHVAGFEVLDVESLRDSYIHTSRAWLRRLEEHREEIVALTDARTYKTFRMYLAGFLDQFSKGRIGVCQTLLRKPGPSTVAPHLDRARWYCDL